MRRVTPAAASFVGVGSSLTLLAAGLAGCVSAAGSPTPHADASRLTTSPPSVPSAQPSSWLVEDFELSGNSAGGFWCAFDHNGLGTEVSPNPFVVTSGGAPPSPGHSARYFGSIGDNRPPYSWAQLQIFLSSGKQPQDLRPFHSVRFWAKGDGGRYSVALVKRAVTDYDHFKQDFFAPSEWTQFTLPVSGFAQAGWGKKLPAVFDDVVQIEFAPASYSRPFDLSIDHIELSREEVVEKPAAYDTAKWFAYRGTDPKKRRGTALDVSRLLDAPAGKHGPVVRRGDGFGFAGGKSVRFWGVNLVGSANFPSHEEADQLAELLAQLGVNITRHHHLDAAWSKPNIFGNGPSTRKLDSTSLERFDYLIAALQKRGIYQFFDMLVSRQPGAADGVTAPSDVMPGFKIEGEFSPQLIDLQLEFIEQFMGHQNPYTHRTYAREPALALIDIINEDSLFWMHEQGEFGIDTPEYRALLGKLFGVWLTKLVPGGRAAIERRWRPDASGGDGLLPSEDPAAGKIDAVVQFTGDEHRHVSRARAKDTLRFYYETSLSYFRRIEAKLRQLGYRALVAGSNHWVEMPVDAYLNAQLDFIDRHAYWAHPLGGWGYRPEISWNPESMLKDTGLGVVGSLASRRVKGLPFAPSEWQAAAPNDYRQEGVLAVGAYAALANFSPLQFAFSHDRDHHPENVERLSSNFDLLEQPTMLAAWPAVSLLFHRQDVAESKDEAVLRIDEASVFQPLFRAGVPKELARLGKTGLGFGQGQSFEQLTGLVTSRIEAGVARANGGELVHDALHGTLLVDTARSQAFAGFRPAQAVKLQNVELELESPFAVVIVTALDDAPIAESKRLLVSALGNAVNSGMTLSFGRNHLENVGSAPVLVEPIVGRVSLRVGSSPSRASVYALGPSGERDHAVDVDESAGAVRFRLSAEHRAMHYEIVRD